MSGFSKTSELPWQLQVFAVSIRKKEKWLWAKAEIEKVLQRARRPATSPASGTEGTSPGVGAGQGSNRASFTPGEETSSTPGVFPAHLHCLDVGSGVGTLSVLMEQLGSSAASARGYGEPKWEFTETDHAAARETRKIVSGPVHEINIFDPKLKAGSFELITAFDVIEHTPNPQKFISRLAELLTPGGTLLLTTPADGHGYYFWRRLAEKLFGIDKAAHGHVVEGFSRSQLEALAIHAGLKLAQLTPFSFFFTEMIELAYNGAYIIKNRAKQVATPGYNLALSPASAPDVAAHAWQLSLLKIVYPLLRSLSLLDRVIPIPPGYEWGLIARKAETAPR